MGVRSVLRFPVCDRGRRSLFRLTTRALWEEQRGHAALSGSFSAICAAFLFSVAFSGGPQHLKTPLAITTPTKSASGLKEMCSRAVKAGLGVFVCFYG